MTSSTTHLRMIWRGPEDSQVVLQSEMSGTSGSSTEKVRPFWTLGFFIVSQLSFM